jgi:phosphatidylglycerophosphate synthase
MRLASVCLAAPTPLSRFLLFPPRQCSSILSFSCSLRSITRLPRPSSKFCAAEHRLPVLSHSYSSNTPQRPPEKRENIYTLPNFLTLTRLLATPAIAFLILDSKPYLATSLLLYAGLTDLIDGYIARRFNLKSVVGTILDPMADKFLMVTLTGALAYVGAMPRTSPPPGAGGVLIVVWLAGIILGRDIGLGIAAFYYRYISLPAPKTFMRFWDFSLPSAEVHPTTISKVLLHVGNSDWSRSIPCCNWS